MLSKRRKKQKIAFIIVVIAMAIGILLSPFVYAKREFFIQQPLVAHLVPFYRSVLKLPDLLFLPRYALFNSELETYQLNIDIKKIRQLDLALPGPFSGGELEDDSKVWVSADFKTSDYQDQVKIRYRGTIANHWNSYKKSYLVKFPKEHLFRGMREINLVIPDDRSYFIEPLNDYRAKKLGLITLESKNVRVSINGIDHGVYLSFEHWSQEWLEKNPISASSIILGIGQSTLGTASSSIFAPDGVQYWKSWNVDIPNLDSVRAMNEIISKADNETFKKMIPHLVSIDEMLAFNVVNILSGDFHGSGDEAAGANNTVMIFDGLIGKFRPVPYNIVTVDIHNSFKQMPSSLERRILAIPEWKEARDRLLKDYLANNNKDDIRFIEDWTKTYNNDFLADQAKAGNSFAYLREINRLKNSVKFFQTEALNHLNDKYPPVLRMPGLLNIPNSYKYLFDIVKTREQFVAEHSEFSLTNNGLVLGGSHYFYQTIVVPANTNLTILPGTTLSFAPGVSFVSYSPILAMGTYGSPIRVAPIDPKQAWGNFVVIDTGHKKNIFDHIIISGGGESIINGIFISGTLAFHGSDVELTNSYLSKAQGDDTLNVKSALGIITNNIFSANSADGIDLDFPDPKTVVKKNTFINNGGDSVDLSWSNIVVEDNIMIGSKDKGVSIGEQSNPIIKGNLLAKNVIGIAIKDNSEAIINNNIIIKNKTGLAAYEKKAFFGGGQAKISGGFLWGNETETQIDKLSKLDFDNVSRVEPNLSKWPQNIQNLIK